MDKMTNVKALRYVVENCELPTEIAEKVGNILATYEKKSAGSADRKPTKEQIANAEKAEEILAFLTAHKGTRYTIADLMKECPACEGIVSTQKLTPMLTALWDKGNGRVVRSTVKGRNMYSVED